MALKEHYREMTTRILMVGDKEHSRKQERRRVYKGNGKRFVCSMGYVYFLNDNNEWRQDVSHLLRRRTWQ